MSKTKRNILILFVTIALVVTGVFFLIRTNFETIAPTPTKLDTTIVAPLSELVFPINFKVEELNAILNTVIDGKFFAAPLTINNRGDILNLEITKSAPLKIKWQMPYLIMEVPLHLEGIGDVKIGKRRISNQEAIEGDLILTLKSQIDISKDWKLKTTSSIKKITWIKEPVLKLLFVKLNLREQVDAILKLKEKELLNNLDQQIGEKIQLKKAIEKIWVDIQKPLQVNRKEINVWIQNRCETIEAKMLNKGDSLISIQVICATHSFVLLDSTNKIVTNGMLPPYKEAENQADEKLHLYIKGSIPYTLINKHLNSKKDKLNSNNLAYDLIIKEIEIYGIENAIAAKVKVRGTFNGDIYLTGKIAFDTISKSLCVKNFNYDMNTKNTLVKSANWVFGSDLPEIISRRLILPLDSAISKIPALMIEGIEKSKVGNKLDAGIKINSVHLYKTIVTQKDIQYIIAINANANIQLERSAFNTNLKPIRIKSVKQK